MTGVGSKPSLGSFAHIPERGEGGHGMVRVQRELLPYLLLVAAFILVILVVVAGVAFGGGPPGGGHVSPSPPPPPGGRPGANEGRGGGRPAQPTPRTAHA